MLLHDMPMHVRTGGGYTALNHLQPGTGKVGGQHHAPAPIVQEGRLGSAPVRTSRERLAHTGIPPSETPARSEKIIIVLPCVCNSNP
jgi:hypothetical protein